MRDILAMNDLIEILSYLHMKMKLILLNELNQSLFDYLVFSHSMQQSQDQMN